MYKLLVVEDEPQTRNALCNYFPWDELGFEIAGQCGNGMQALDFLSHHPTDVVLCDILMPVMSGIELAEAIKNNKIKVKVVFLSAHQEFEYARKALELGVCNYIVKPARYKDLVAVFSKVKSELDCEYSMSQASHSYTVSDEIEGYDYKEKIISIVKLYLEESYKEASLEEAAELVHMNPNYLSQFFKQNTGKYFSDFLTEIRMHKAADLLKDITLKTYEIGEMVGYSNARNFTRAFKNFFQKSPREFKTSHNIIED